MNVLASVGEWAENADPGCHTHFVSTAFRVANCVMAVADQGFQVSYERTG